MSLVVSEPRFMPATAAEAATGLLGWASVLLDGSVRIDGLAVRRKLDGGLTLAWPARTDRLGQRHPLVRPVTNAARRALESDIFRALGLGGGRP